MMGCAPSFEKPMPVVVSSIVELVPFMVLPPLKPLESLGLLLALLRVAVSYRVNLESLELSTILNWACFA